MSLTAWPWACRWETSESHHNFLPFVRMIRIFVSGSVRHEISSIFLFYSRPLLPTGGLPGCTAACPLAHPLPLHLVHLPQAKSSQLLL
jgi:hypothetical protein